jgi:enoyl-CoA hydratase
MLCGMSKAKYYLLTCRKLSGEEAERIGMVSMCTEEGDLLTTAREVATELSFGAQDAIRLTKHSMNMWYRQNLAIFDASLGYEFLNFGGPDVREGVASHREKRKPKFV